MKSKIGTVAVIMFAYHMLAMIKDAEQCALNWRRFQADPNPQTLLTLMLADGVLTRDILAF